MNNLSLLIIPIVLVMMVIPVYADNNNAKPTLQWQIKVFFEDVQELITTDPQKKAQLVLEHVEQRQIEIDYLESQNQPIPKEFEERRLAKLDQAERLVADSMDLPFSDEHGVMPKTASDSADPLVKAISTLKRVGELNEIRIAYSEFPDVINSGDENQIKEFNEKINSLDTWNDYCSGTFDANEYSHDPASFDRLTEKCPALKQHSINEIKGLFNGMA